MATRCTFLVEDGKYWKDFEDGEMSRHSDRQWWMFPKGLQVGYPVQYYETRDKEACENSYSSVVESHGELFAMGSISSISGGSLTFTMEGAVKKWRKKDGGYRSGELFGSTDIEEDWCLAEVPDSVSKLEANVMPGVQSTSRQQEAKWMDMEVGCDRIAAHLQAKSVYESLVESFNFVVMLSAMEPQEAGHLRVTLTLLSGEIFSLNVEAGSSEQTVSNLVKTHRDLKEGTRIKFVNGEGRIVDVASALSAALLPGV